MTMISAAEAAQKPILTGADIEQRVKALIGSACRRSLWLLFTDRDDIQLKVLIPIEDYPTGPCVGDAESLAAMMKQLMGDLDAAHVILIWERRGSERFTPSDRAWARAMHDACSDSAVSVRAQLISHRSGVRSFSPDDYV
ncbi:MAG TPA: hypothetical protein VIJ18_06605 [Microbacteriaceae bacterium]